MWETIRRRGTRTAFSLAGFSRTLKLKAERRGETMLLVYKCASNLTYCLFLFFRALCRY